MRYPLFSLLRGNRHRARDVSVGAIRWDAWYNPAGSPVRQAIEASLGPVQYQHRAPTFAVSTGPDTISIGGGQSDIEREIIAASRTGLDYWAFVWYSPTDDMQAGWRYFQASPFAKLINWCLLFAGFQRFRAQATATLALYLSYLEQDNYQTVMRDRPLIFILEDGTDVTGVRDAISELRTAAVFAGLPNPYVVVLSWPAQAVSDLEAIGADAIGAYAYAPATNAGSYASLDLATRARWREMAATGKQSVPIGMAGWDRRPRIERPVPWEPWQLPGVGMTNYYAAPTPQELAEHLRALVAWSRGNPAVPSQMALVYAWDEHDEGGWLNPTLGQDTSRLEAVAAVLR